MKSYEEILATEYSPEFDKLRKDRMVTSYFKYGPLAENYPDNVDAETTLEKRYALFQETRNLEYLLDVANMAMIAYMRPRKGDYYKPLDSDKSPGIAGLSVKEAECFKEMEIEE